MKDIFVIRFATDNKFENKGMSILIMGIVENNIYKLYQLKVNDDISTKRYYALLKEEDFSITDFKQISFDKIKEYILKNKENIKNYIFSNMENEVKKLIEI